MGDGLAEFVQDVPEITALSDRARMAGYIYRIARTLMERPAAEALRDKPE